MELETFTVEIYAVEWCGFSEYYDVRAANEDEAKDKALYLHEQDFVAMFDLILTEHGYIESEDLGEDGDCDEDDCSTLDVRLVC